MPQRSEPLSNKVRGIDSSAYQQWKEEQAKEIGQSGPKQDVEAEAAYNTHMLRQNLNGYVCHKELDAYMSCLQEKHLIPSREDEGLPGTARREPKTNDQLYAKLCKRSYHAYTACLGSKANQETIMENAVLEPHCGAPRAEFFGCLDRTKDTELATREPQCAAPYRHLLRCGLNHLWNRYWRALTQFSNTDEFHVYELERDDVQRQEYMQHVLSGAAQEAGRPIHGTVIETTAASSGTTGQ